jgi:hypothetical protein
MALLSLVESAPRAYRLKASNAAQPISTASGTIAVTSLKDHLGNFYHYPITDEELEAARHDPNQVIQGPLDIKWRIMPDTE